MSTPVEGKVAIVGAGLMGAQIGAEYGLAGYRVALCCRSEEAAGEAVSRARSALDKLVELGAVSPEKASAARERLYDVASVTEACRDAAIIVESVVEDFAAKVKVLGEIGAAAPQAIVASNTSSLLITQLGEASGLNGRFLGTHYWNPPTLMPLVEVVTGSSTAPDVADEVQRMLREAGKEPVVVPDIPGFVWNRLQFALLREALALVEHHAVDPATIDRIVTRGLGCRWSLLGPFESAALGGTNTFATVASILFPEIERATADPATLLQVPAPSEDARLTLTEWRDSGLGRLLSADRREGPDTGRQ